MTEQRRPILLVEDNEDDVELALLALRDVGERHAVFVARDGVEAVDHLFGTDAIELPLFVILDIQLPKLSGFQVLRKIRENDRTRRVPVVVMSSSDSADDIRLAYDLGANSYVMKQVDFSKYETAVARMGSYWTDVNLGCEEGTTNG